MEQANQPITEGQVTQESPWTAIRDMFPSRLSRLRLYGKIVSVGSRVAIAGFFEDMRDSPVLPKGVLERRYEDRRNEMARNIAEWAVEKEICSLEAREQYLSANNIEVEM